MKQKDNKEIESFIDFIKGLLRFDPGTRWTATMAMKHPFISRMEFTGPYEPQADERQSTNGLDTNEDSLSAHSSSSRDSQDIRIVGSCPSNILA